MSASRDSANFLSTDLCCLNWLDLVTAQWTCHGNLQWILFCHLYLHTFKSLSDSVSCCLIFWRISCVFSIPSVKPLTFFIYAILLESCCHRQFMKLLGSLKEKPVFVLLRIIEINHLCPVGILASDLLTIRIYPDRARLIIFIEIFIVANVFNCFLLSDVRDFYVVKIHFI